MQVGLSVNYSKVFSLLTSVLTEQYHEVLLFAFCFSIGFKLLKYNLFFI